MKAVSRTDFGGGIGEQFTASASAPDSVAKAKGFILDGTDQLRTQWDCEAVVSGTSFRAVKGFRSGNQDYLVGIRTDHQLVYVNLSNDTLTDLGITLSSSHMPAGIVPRGESTYTQEVKTDGVISTPETEFVLYAGSGVLVNSPLTGTDAYVVYETTPGTLAVETYSNTASPNERYPALEQHASITDFLIPSEGVMPHGSLSVLWDDKLVTADVRWYDGATTQTLDTDTSTSSTTLTAPTALDDGTTTRYGNAMWVSQPGDVYSYGNLDVDVPVSSDSKIVDLAVVDLGMIVLSTTSSGEDGLLLLRGGPSDYKVVRLRSLSGTRGATDDDFHLSGDVWDEVGTYCFVSNSGAVYMTNGEQVVRLDGPTSVDFNSATWQDHVHAVGQYLFLSHSGRMLCMRSFGGGGAWTEMLLPSDGVQAQSMTSAGGNLYFLQSGSLFRFDMVGGGYGSMPAGSDSDEFVLATSTMDLSGGDGEGFSSVQVHRSGFTLSSETSGNVVSLTTHAGPALAPDHSYDVTIGDLVDERFEVVAKAGIGFVREAAVECRLTGDVVVESVTVWVSPGRRRW